MDYRSSSHVFNTAALITRDHQEYTSANRQNSRLDPNPGSMRSYPDLLLLNWLHNARYLSIGSVSAKYPNGAAGACATSRIQDAYSPQFRG